MKVFFKIFCLVLICSSCLKQSETITPMAKATTLAELQQEMMARRALEAGNAELSYEAHASYAQSSDPTLFYLTIKYNLKKIDAFEVASIPNAFEQIGDSFLRAVVKIVLAVAGPQQVDIPPFELEIPDLNLDRSIVKSIKIRRIFLQYNEELDLQHDFAPTFNFLDTLELAQEVTVPRLGKVDTLLLSYRKKRNRCMQKCLSFEIVNDNVLDFFDREKMVKLKPSLQIAGLPEINDMVLDGQIELQIGLKLPF